MKISHDSFLRLCNNPLKSFKSLLFYGNSDFLAQWKIDHLLKKNPDLIRLQVQQISQEAILESKEPLSNTLMTQDFFRGPEIIIITHSTDKVTLLIEQMLESMAPLPFFIVKAQDYLKPTSKLRKLYEGNPDLGSVACYELTATELEKEITSFFTQHGKKISLELAHRIGEFFRPSPEALKSELEKILLYMGPQESVEAMDLKKSLSLSSPIDTSNLVNAFLNKNKKILINCVESLEDTSSYISTLRALGSSLLRLHQIKCEIDKGEPFEKAIQKLSPPLLFTEHSSFKKRLYLWSKPALEEGLKKMSEIEILIKINSRTAKEIFEFSILEAVSLV